MKCQEFEDRLQLLLDDREAPERDEQLLAHANGCPGCREMLQAQEALFEALPRTKTVARPAWLATVGEKVIAASLVEKASEGKTARVPRWRIDMRWLSVGLVGVAAAVVLMFSPAWKAITGPRENGVKPEQTVHQDEPGNRKNRGQYAITRSSLPRDKQPQKPVPPGPLPGPSPAQAPSPQLNDYQLALHNWMQAFPEAVDVERLEESPGIRPLASSIGLAIDTLRRALPGHREDMMNPVKPAGAWIPAWLDLT